MYGAILQGIGSVAQGFGLGNSEPDKGPDIHVQYKENRFHEAELFRQKMAMAKNHGIHPLAMLGIPTSNFQPAVTVGGSDGGTDWSSIGAGAGQIANTFVKPPEDKPPELSEFDRRTQAANLRILEANAKRAEWEALGTEFKVADYAAPRLLTGQPGNPPGARVSNDAVEMQRIAAEQSGLSPSVFTAGSGLGLKQEVLPPHPLKLGYGAATDQAFVTTMDSTGRPGTVLNQNALQAEFNDGATMTLLTRIFGVDRAIEIMAAMEQLPLVGGIGAALGAAGIAGKRLYDYLGRQKTDADRRRDEMRREHRRRSIGRVRNWFRKGGD